MPERVRFHFDPRCPWAYQTARWMRRLEHLGEVEVSWAPFALSVVHQTEEKRAAPDGDGAPALRTVIALRAARGEVAVGAFYEALGWAIHVEKRVVDDPHVITAALRAAGADPSIYEQAMREPATWQAVLAEHEAAVRDKDAFGVPTIVLDGGDGPAMFGPVMYELPDDEGCRELWSHVRWLMRNENVAELKRERSKRPVFHEVTQERHRAA
ncbi:MAG TPA: DsbA family protein [Dehalococcoidia bacterium]|nr:DsbA family protein [Dehalococcoidia bacterium]